MIDGRARGGCTARLTTCRVVALALGCVVTLGLTVTGCDSATDPDSKATTDAEDRLESLDGVESVATVQPQDDDKLHALTVTVRMAEDATAADYVAALEELQLSAKERSELFAAEVAHPDSTDDGFVGVKFIGTDPQKSSPEQQVDWLFRGLALWPDVRQSVESGTYFAEFGGPDEVGPAILAMTADPSLSQVDSAYVGFVADSDHIYGVGINSGFDDELATVWEGAVAALRPLGVPSNSLYLNVNGVADEAHWLMDLCTDIPDGPPPLAQHRHDLVPAIGQLLDLLVLRNADFSISACGRHGRTFLSMDASGQRASFKGQKDWVQWSEEHVTPLGVEVG